MTDFNYKKYLTENKLTQTTKLRAGILAEGQFSWMTQDTGQQIGSQDENKIPVYMFDDKGKYYYENDYDGYGVFGGMDYYELLDKMNGGEGDRGRGIDLSFDKIKTTSPVLYPALVTKPNEFNYKSHDFTQEAPNDPNQSWYMEPEEEDYNGEDDYDYSNDYDENSGDGYIDDTDSEYDTGVDEGKKEYYKDAEADDAEHIKSLEKDMKDDKKSSKMKMSELKTKIKEMVLAEMNITEDTFAPESEEDFLAEVTRILKENSPMNDPRTEQIIQMLMDMDVDGETMEYILRQVGMEDQMANQLVNNPAEYAASLKEANEFNTNKPARIAEFLKALDLLLYDEYHAELFDSKEVKQAYDLLVKAVKKLENLNEADEEVAVDGEENIDVDTTIQVDPNVKAVQDALTQAQAAAQKLGDPKLTDQIGNTITFFTRAHVVEKGAVAEADEMEEGEKSSMNEVEGKLVDEKTGEEVTLPYETLDFRGDPMTVISFRAPHKPSSTGRIYTKGGGEYFPSVAGLKIIDHSFSEDLNESMFPMLKRILK
jgi:hypothetical protein